MQNILDKIKQVKSGQSLRDAVTSDYLNAIREAILKLASGDNISCRDILKKSGPGYVVLSGNAKGKGGSTKEYQPFEMELVKVGAVQKIRVYASTLSGGSSTGVGFAEGDPDPGYLLTAAEGVLQGGITIDSSGNVTSRWLEIVSALDDDTDDTFYVEIGTITQDEETDAWTVSNSRYGPIPANICRNWFASEAPYYGVTWLS